MNCLNRVRVGDSTMTPDWAPFKKAEITGIDQYRQHSVQSLLTIGIQLLIPVSNGVFSTQWRHKSLEGSELIDIEWISCRAAGQVGSSKPSFFYSFLGDNWENDNTAIVRLQAA